MYFGVRNNYAYLGTEKSYEDFKCTEVSDETVNIIIEVMSELEENPQLSRYVKVAIDALCGVELTNNNVYNAYSILQKHFSIYIQEMRSEFPKEFEKYL
jgi:Na+-transporting NADH:ubiquinone oxidoreductase subunit NqrC